jgi:hypothetical protein
MANGVRARILGDDYQALVFWIQVCRMLQGTDHIVAVEIESADLKSLDDIVVRYEAPQSDKVCSFVFDCYQVKYHVDYQGAITAEALIDPLFINAKKSSFLQRAHQIWKRYRQEGCRIIFYSAWSIDSHDILSSVVSTCDKRLYLKKFFESKWKRKNDYRAVLQKWMLHLGISDQKEMSDFLTYLRIEPGLQLETLEDILNDKLLLAGLKPILNGKFNSYLEAARCFIKDNKIRLNKEEIISVCKQNDLWNGQPLISPRRKKIGIKAVCTDTPGMKKWADAVCDLTKHFEGRELLGDCNWFEGIAGPIYSFLSKELSLGDDCELWIAAHTTIAILCGYVLNVHSGTSVSLVQNGNAGRQIWPIPSFIPKLHPSSCTSQITELEHTVSRDLAVAVSITNDVYEDVCLYMQQNPVAGRLLHLRHQSCGPCAIADAAAAIECAETIMREVKHCKMEYNPSAQLHFFISAPNAFSFVLGQRIRGLGLIHLYEFDNERCRSGTYKPSLQLPLKKGL